MKTLADGTKETTVAIEGMNQAMRGGATYSEQFIRHLKWISQGIVLWAGINAISNAISEWARIQRDLNWSLTEFEMRTGAAPAQVEEFRQAIIDVSRETATIPSELAVVAPVAPDEATLRYAAELQRVAGGDMQNQMQWLIAQQRQFHQEGEATVNVLDAMASGWRLTTLPMSQFITMLRDAAPLAEEFSLSMEEMYSMFGALQAVTGAEGRELDYLVRNLRDHRRRYGEPDTHRPGRRRLVGYVDTYHLTVGIGEGTPRVAWADGGIRLDEVRVGDTLNTGTPLVFDAPIQARYDPQAYRVLIAQGAAYGYRVFTDCRLLSQELSRR